MKDFKFNKNQPSGSYASSRYSMTSGSETASEIMGSGTPKIPAVRPRSSLSTDEHYRFKDPHDRYKAQSITIFTLIGGCVFLLVMCGFLLAALVFVGKTVVNRELAAANSTAGRVVIGDCSEGAIVGSNSSGEVIFRLNQLNSESDKARKMVVPVSKEIMQSSKVLHLLKYRLPKVVRPTFYKLHLHPDLRKKTFSGEVTIAIDVDEPIKYIPVHAHNLTVETKEFVSLDKEGMRPIVPALTFQHPELQYWVTEFPDAIEPGNYSMTLKFSGSLKDRIVGFYQSSYLIKDTNETRWIATSKFEPTYARQAFPCFDEPAMKAVFEVTLVRPTNGGYVALSNMNQKSEEVKGDTTIVTFAPSVRMSTYVACFIVADFDNIATRIEPSVGSPFDLKVYTTKDQMQKATYALDVGARIIRYYIDYFNIPYPLPKLDMAAIPDFVSGAMEHWGLVTFRQTSLLFDEETSSSSNKERVADVIAHELTHMWFGNLVTMKWWNDLWLNEGFATYIEYKGMDVAHPEWKILDRFPLIEMHSVLRLDATLASHPIVQTVENPDEITELFHSITYSKGATIIRMLEDFVGEDVFKEAVRGYLRRYQYKNADTDDFLNEFELFNLPHDVKTIMKTWTAQMGVPVIEVTRVSPKEFNLKQKRFFLNPNDYNDTYTDSEFNYRWTIPVTYVTNVNPTVQRSWFYYNDAETNIELPDAADWIKINKDQIGYYLVNYPEEMWQELKKTLFNTPTAFSASDRAHLMHDAFALTDASQLSFDIALDLTQYLKNELEFAPWVVASNQLLDWRNCLYSTDIYSGFQKYALSLLEGPYQYLGWDYDSDNLLKNSFRTKILYTACTIGHDECLEEVGTRFKLWLTQPEVRPKPDFRTLIYRFGMRHYGNETVWHSVWDLYKRETDANEKLNLLNSLSSIQTPWILHKLIHLAWDENNVRGQDYFTCLSYISRNPIGSSIVWDHVRENWQKLVDRFGINERYLGQLIPDITRLFNMNVKLREMEDFFQKYPEAGAGKASRKIALEGVKNNIKWMERNKKKFESWLKKNFGPLPY